MRSTRKETYRRSREVNISEHLENGDCCTRGRQGIKKAPRISPKGLHSLIARVRALGQKNMDCTCTPCRYANQAALRPVSTLVFYIETRLRSMIQIKVEIFHVANISPCSKQFAPRCTKKRGGSRLPPLNGFTLQPLQAVCPSRQAAYRFRNAPGHPLPPFRRARPRYPGTPFSRKHNELRSSGSP